MFLICTRMRYAKEDNNMLLIVNKYVKRMTKRRQSRVLDLVVHEKIKFLTYSFIHKTQPSMLFKNKDILFILAKQSASTGPKFFKTI